MNYSGLTGSGFRVERKTTQVNITCKDKTQVAFTILTSLVMKEMQNKEDTVV